MSRYLTAAGPRNMYVEDEPSWIIAVDEPGH